MFYPPRYGTPEKALLLRSAPKSTTLSKMVHPTRAPQMATSVVGTIMGRKRMIKREMGTGKSNSNKKKNKASHYQTARKNTPNVD